MYYCICKTVYVCSQNIYMIFPPAFDLAASSSSKTRCRTKAAENHSSLWGEVAAVEREGCCGSAHRSPSPSEERAEGPGHAESQVDKSEQWEGTEAHEKAKHSCTWYSRNSCMCSQDCVVSGPETTPLHFTAQPEEEALAAKSTASTGGKTNIKILWWMLSG